MNRRQIRRVSSLRVQEMPYFDDTFFVVCDTDYILTVICYRRNAHCETNKQNSSRLAYTFLMYLDYLIFLQH